MKNLLGCAFLVFAISLFGCIPSLHPVYREDQLVFNSKFLGTWVQDGSRWEFSKRDARSYNLVVTGSDGKSGRFVAHLANIDGTIFLDLQPHELGSAASSFYTGHFVPIHSIYLVRSTQPALELAAIDGQWLNKFLEENPSAIDSAKFGDGRFLTAPTAQVQAFVLQHKDRFTGKFTLESDNTRGKSASDSKID